MYIVIQANFIFSYKLVSYTKNVVDLNIAMGAPKEAMWMTKFLEDRFTVRNVSSDGQISMMWSIRWKFCELTR